jgi:hypothetical protein
LYLDTSKKLYLPNVLTARGEKNLQNHIKGMPD